jgi:hypothetical protein
MMRVWETRETKGKEIRNICRIKLKTIDQGMEKGELSWDPSVGEFPRIDWESTGLWKSASQQVAPRSKGIC